MKQTPGRQWEYFEGKFAMAALHSEKRKSAILALLFAGILSIFLVIRMSIPSGDIDIRMAYGMGVFFSLIAAYETGLFLFYRSRIRHSKYLSSFLYYRNTTLEITLPVLFTYFQSFVMEPGILALHTPENMLVFLFLLLSTLHLNPRICIYAGAMAALQHFVLALYLISESPPDAAPYLIHWVPHIVRSSLLFFFGLAAALITHQIRKQMFSSLESLEERNHILNMFGEHVSPVVVNKLLEQNTGALSETRHVCVMFLDIRNFTKFSENRTPGEVVNFLNNCFGFMIEIINANNGIINKFLGDGFMAVFGAPFSDGNHSRNAVRASLEIVKRIEQEIEASQLPRTRIGIGLSDGDAVTGNIGSHLRKEYTVIGDVVNLAARIEQLNKKFDSQVLVSNSVWKAIEAEGEFSANHEDLGRMEIRGRDKPVEIHKLA